MTKVKPAESIAYPKGTGVGSRYGSPQRSYVDPAEALKAPGANAQPNPAREALRRRQAK